MNTSTWKQECFYKCPVRSSLSVWIMKAKWFVREMSVILRSERIRRSFNVRLSNWYYRRDIFAAIILRVTRNGERQRTRSSRNVLAFEFFVKTRRAYTELYIQTQSPLVIFPTRFRTEFDFFATTETTRKETTFNEISFLYYVRV